MSGRTVSTIWTAAVLVVATACSGGDPILIGLAGPVSEDRGMSMQLAAELAINEVNRRGGVNGRNLQLVIKDDSANAQAAVRVARELYDDQAVVAVIGHLTSGTTIAAAPIYNGGSNPLLEISPSASSPSVTNAGPYTFRVCPSDLEHGGELARWATTEIGAERAAVLYRNNDYGRGVRRTFIEAFEAEGGLIVHDDPYILEIPGFDPFIRLLGSQGGADVLLIAGNRAGAERIVPTVQANGLPIQILGGDGLTGIERSDVDADGILISTAYLADQPGERNATFVNSYRSAYGNRVPDHRGAGAYDIIFMLAQALEETGSDDRTQLRDYFEGYGTTRPAFEGVTGSIGFDANGDVVAKQVVIGRVTGGQLLTAPRE